MGNLPSDASRFHVDVSECWGEGGGGAAPAATTRLTPTSAVYHPHVSSSRHSAKPEFTFGKI